MAHKATKRKRLLIAGGIALLLIGIGGFIWQQNLHRTKTEHTSDTAPSFQAVLPANTSIDDLGGWQKLTPPNGDPLFVYIDEIDGVSISVSQQPLPDGFEKNTDTKVTEVAQGYNATTVLNADHTKVYIGTNAKGPQSVIFTKNNLLIFIKSQQKIQDSAWISYVNSLQ